MSRWTCPDCPVNLPDAGAALGHEERLGHGVPVLDLRRPRTRAVVPVDGQLELPGVSTRS